MRTVRSLFLPSLLLALLSPAAHAVCVDWHIGPIQNDASGNGTDAAVHALGVWDPDGAGPLPARLVAGGVFDHVGGAAAPRIAYFDPTDGQWHSFDTAERFADVRSIYDYDGSLIAGAGVTWDLNHSAVARWTGTQWLKMGRDDCRNDFTNMRPDWVRALAVYRGTLWAGGGNTAWDGVNPQGQCSGGQYGYGLSGWDGDAHWRLSPIPVLTEVHALAVFGNSFFVAGSSTEAPPNWAYPDVEIWDGSGWVNYGSRPNGNVNALQVWNGGVVAGGAFTQIAGQPRTRLAFWNGASWAPIGGGVDDSVFALAVYHGELIAGGSFATASGLFVNDIARWTGSNWVPLGLGLNGTVRALTVWNDQLVAGGDFTQAGGAPANHIARWDGTQWSSFGGGSSSLVYALASYAGRLVAGGNFDQNTSVVQPAHDVVGWDGSSFVPYGTGMDGSVRALKGYTFGSQLNQTAELVAGGDFAHAGGVAASRIAKWDQGTLVIGPSQWTPMGAGFDGSVYAIERTTISGATNTYAAGNFTWSGGTFLGNIGRWNATTSAWEPLQALNGPVYALKGYGGYLYAGGGFTTAGGVSTGGLARWNGTAWSACGGFFNGSVYALEVFGGQLVIGGSYPGINGSPNLARFDGTSYSTLGSGGTNGLVRCLGVSGSRLYVGGEFTTAGGVSASHAAYWDGAWRDANGGVNLGVYAIAPFHGEVNFGGVFNRVGGTALVSPTWGRWLETGVPWLVSATGSRTVDSRGDVVFSVVPATGYDPLTYQWFRNGVPLEDGLSISGMTISGAHVATLTLTRVESVDAGDYSCVISNACGTISTTPATLSVNPTVGVGVGVPGAAVFESAGPNPTRAGTRIAFTLSNTARVTVDVHDLAGRTVRALDLGSLAAGGHSVQWDGRSESGVRVAPGVYLVSVAADRTRLGVRHIAIIR